MYTLNLDTKKLLSLNHAPIAFTPGESIYARWVGVCVDSTVIAASSVQHYGSVQ
jgi:hypothetical protein